ncbi:carbohydrate sulfotransferase 1-like [Amphiura filiformis]|uniref:carbohydrate sulfotransferase 1-like n=1 Tax=Amphiura filiformis TaxID=82378 RepID=UPI003B2179C8
MRFRRLIRSSVVLHAVSICLLFGAFLNWCTWNLHTNYVKGVRKNDEILELHVKDNIQTRPNHRDLQVHVIIISRWRYGSSFTGDVFNKNYDFSYFYEPLRHKTSRNQETHNVLHQDHVTMLRDILKCEFTDKNYTWWDDEDTKMNCWRSCKFGASVMCEHHNRLNKRVHEKRTGLTVNNRLHVQRNAIQTSRMVEEICRSGKHVAIKTVRVPDLKHLKSIVMDDSLNVKVIQLVRDPRGVYLSRKVMPDVVDMELSECDELKNNLKYWKDPPPWLKGRYMLLRYEDLVDKPIQMVQIIYNFLGIPVPEHVKTWLLINAKKLPFKSAYSWRTKINYETMVNVQEYCMEILLMTGYKAINSKRYLTDLNQPSIVQLSYPLMPRVPNS